MIDRGRPDNHHPSPVMTIDVKVPAFGESITSANVSRWHKQSGQAVHAGELLVTLETDKVSNELEAVADGILEILVAEDREVPIGTVIATLTPVSAATPPPAKPASAAAVPPITVSLAHADGLTGVPPVMGDGASRLPACPPDKLAEAAGPQEREIPAASSDGRTTRRKMSMLRRKIASQLVSAQHSAAILTTFQEVDMTSVIELRKQVQEDFQKKYGTKLGFMSFFVKAVAQALKDVPTLNARIDGTDVIENHFYDIGVAIGTDKGLVVPVIRDADTKSFARIERDILDFATRTRDGKITIADLQGGVFTISNGGTYGSLLSTPILNPPQSGILGMHTIQQRPVALNGQVVIRPMMYLALSYDHRLVDGKEAVTFLVRIKEYLEAPVRLLLEP